MSRKFKASERVEVLMYKTGRIQIPQDEEEDTNNNVNLGIQRDSRAFGRAPPRLHPLSSMSAAFSHVKFQIMSATNFSDILRILVMSMERYVHC